MGPKEKSPGSTRARGNASESRSGRSPARSDNTPGNTADPADATPAVVTAAAAAAAVAAAAAASPAARAPDTEGPAAAVDDEEEEEEPTEEDDLGLVTVAGFASQKAVMSYNEQKTLVQTLNKGDVLRMQLLLYARGTYHLRSRDAQVVERTRGEHSSAVLVVRAPGGEPVRLTVPRRPTTRCNILIHDVVGSGAVEHSIEALLLDIEDGVSAFRCSTWRSVLPEPLDSHAFRGLLRSLRDELRLEPYPRGAVWPVEGPATPELTALGALNFRLRQIFNIMRSLGEVQVLPGCEEGLKTVWSHTLAAAQSCVDEAIEHRLRAASTKNALEAFRALRAKGMEREPALVAVLAPRSSLAWPALTTWMTDPPVSAEVQPPTVELPDVEPPNVERRGGCTGSCAAGKGSRKGGFEEDEPQEEAPERESVCQPGTGAGDCNRPPGAAGAPVRHIATQVYAICGRRAKHVNGEADSHESPGRHGGTIGVSDEASLAEGTPSRGAQRVVLRTPGRPSAPAAGTLADPTASANTTAASAAVAATAQPASARAVVAQPDPQHPGSAGVLPDASRQLGEGDVRSRTQGRTRLDRTASTRSRAPLPTVPLPRSAQRRAGASEGTPPEGATRVPRASRDAGTEGRSFSAHHDKPRDGGGVGGPSAGRAGVPTAVPGPDVKPPVSTGSFCLAAEAQKEKLDQGVPPVAANKCISAKASVARGRAILAFGSAAVEDASDVIVGEQLGQLQHRNRQRECDGLGQPEQRLTRGPHGVVPGALPPADSEPPQPGSVPRDDQRPVGPPGGQAGDSSGKQPSRSHMVDNRLGPEWIHGLRKDSLAPHGLPAAAPGLANADLPGVEDRSGTLARIINHDVLQASGVCAPPVHGDPQRAVPGVHESAAPGRHHRSRRSPPNHSSGAGEGSTAQPGLPPPNHLDVGIGSPSKRRGPSAEGGFHTDAGRVPGDLEPRNQEGPSAPGGRTVPAAVGGKPPETKTDPAEAEVTRCLPRPREDHGRAEEGSPGPFVPQSQERSAVLPDRPRGTDPSGCVQGKAREPRPASGVRGRAEMGDGARSERHGGAAPASRAGRGVKGALASTFPASFPATGYVYYGVNDPGVDLALPILSSDEGATTVVKSVATGKKLKLATQVPNNDLVMARTTSNCINLSLIGVEAPHMAPVLSYLTSIRAFTALFDENRLADWLPKQHLSRGMAKHLTPMLECDAVESVSFRPAEVPPEFYNVLYRTWMKLHLVPKKSGEGRLIANAIPINELQIPPPDMALPRIHEVISHILNANVAGQTDGVSYFCQFELAPEIRPFFKAKLADNRGTIHRVQLKRLPMGWKYAPAIAQHTSNWLVRDLGVAWVDNFVITGADVADYEAKRTQFLERLDRYNVEVDDRTMQGDVTIRVLGVECDLSAKRYRMDPAWIEKRRASWTEFTAAQRNRNPVPLRRALEFFGAMIWATYTKGIPLWAHAESMAALSQIAQLDSDYDEVHLIPAYALQDIEKWTDEVCRNEWQELKKVQAQPNHFVFSDASDVGGAFVEVLNGAVLAKGAWKTTQPEHIFLAETRALAKGAKASVDMLAPLYCTDNRPLHWCIVKGHSSSYAANVLLREAFGSGKPKSAWISTTLNPVDGWSRGHYGGLDWNQVNAAIKAADAWGEASRSVSEANAACEERIRDVTSSCASMSCVEEK